ncbi:hypothetical protein [Metabacillus fastidiosus]|uniref:hypothetical protein n=1 Tax=Metabacillus fastidiosus TaxID=1458 RepID=UPI003D28DE7C
MRILLFSFFIIHSAFLTACSNDNAGSKHQEVVEPPPTERAEVVSEGENKKEQLKNEQETAKEIVEILKARDMQSFAKFVHPAKGVRFSPYAYIKQDEDLVFQADQVKGLLNDSTVYHWGEFDGSGEPIELTFEQYFNKFIYDEDYVKAEKISINKRLGQGNTIDNSKEIYKEATIVEYHFPGFDKELEGMDWKSLRIVMEKQEGKWFLVGIIHDEWTI